MVVKEPEVSCGSFLTLHVLPAKRRFLRVGDSGFEPLTSSASRKRSPPELIARAYFATPRGGTRNRTGVQGFADPCLTTRPCRQRRPTARAEDGIRTRDPHHGKVRLSQLAYFRIGPNLARPRGSYKRSLNHLFREKITKRMMKKLIVDATITEMIFAALPAR